MVFLNAPRTRTSAALKPLFRGSPCLPKFDTDDEEPTEDHLRRDAREWPAGLLIYYQDYYCRRSIAFRANNSGMMRSSFRGHHIRTAEVAKFGDVAKIVLGGRTPSDSDSTGREAWSDGGSHMLPAPDSPNPIN
jgi:hypothetical protein